MIAHSPSDSPALPTGPSPATVLVLDDQSAIRSLIDEVLSSHGYRVMQAASLGEAEAILEKENFDTIIVDIFLSEQESGLSLLPKAREFQPHAPTIVISGMANMDNVMEALKAGAYDMITKPFNILDMLHVVARAVEKKRMADENLSLMCALRDERDSLEKRVQAATHDLQTTIESLRELNEQLATLFELGQAWIDDASAESMIHHILELLARTIIFDGAFCVIYDVKAHGILMTHNEGPDAEACVEIFKAFFRTEGPAIIHEAASNQQFNSEYLLQLCQQKLGTRMAPGSVFLPLYVPQTLLGMFGLLRPAGSALLEHAEQRILSVAIAHLLAGLEQRNFIARSGQLAGLGELIAEIAHDLRNPMTSLRGASRMLVDGWSDENKRTRCLDEISGNLGRMESLVAELVNFYNPREMNIVSLDLHSLLDKTLEVSQALFEQKSIAVVREYAGSPIKILGLTRNLIEAFINLISNACQAMGEGGRLELATTTELDELDHEILLKADRQPSRYVLVTVRDNGCGIPEENLDKIFRRFFTTRPEGHGLGLSAVVRILKKNLGHIRLESQVGVGTAFFVYLPKA
jgi:signal transduction histidine kinase/DNA-binding response OmpR family regulator